MLGCCREDDSGGFSKTGFSVFTTITIEERNNKWCAERLALSELIVTLIRTYIQRDGQWWLRDNYFTMMIGIVCIVWLEYSGRFNPRAIETSSVVTT